MSASPAGGPSGPPSTTPNGAPQNGVMRRRTHANPLVAKKKVVKKPMTTTRPQTVPMKASAPVKQDQDDDPSTYTAYPLVTSKKELLQGLRFHAMRMVSEQEANPYDESQFTRPLRLHRRYPRDQRLEPVVVENPVDNKEKEKEEIRKAERQAQKEANQAQIAPTEKATQKKLPHFKKKVEDVFYPQDTPEAQKRAKLRYEEGRPWHLEDFDSKNTWIGTYEEPLSETHAMLVLDANGSFRMVPLEKWYRFIPTNRYKTMNLDEAEKHMAKKVKDSRWFVENTMSEEQKIKLETQRQSKMQRGRVGMRGERSGPLRGDDDDEVQPEVVHDADEIDYNAEDEFQDDDEGGLFLGDEEEVKESERKIRQEMLGANIFAGTGVKEEKDWDAEEEKEKRDAAAERKRQRRMRRALVKNERKFEYESESDHPYSEESESENEDIDLLKDDETKKTEDTTSPSKPNGDKIASGVSSVDGNTPSNRTEKHGDAARSLHSLKRPGSPNLSEASSSESSRKRIKKENLTSNGHPARPMSPSLGGARPMSPAASVRRRNPTSGSDTEASGTERSGRPKTTSSSLRAASPSGASTPYPPSRPGSPVSITAAGAGATARLPTADEVRAAIPAQGVTITDLTRRFRAQIPKTKEAMAAFIQLVKSAGRYAPHDKTLIVPK